MLAYKSIRDDIEALIEILKTHEKLNNEKYYYKIRELDRYPEIFASLSNVEIAARLIYLNKTCYNGLYRVNSKGLFNVPYGRYVRPAICDETLLRSVHVYLKKGGSGVKISHGDFAAAVKDAGKGSFIYFDPPYHGRNDTSFTTYQAIKFDEGEQERLRDVFIEKTLKEAKCLLSNSDTPFIRKIYKDSRFFNITVKARRAINSDGGGRGKVNEVLIKNYR
jgi:DNA adenine methylase